MKAVLRQCLVGLLLMMITGVVRAAPTVYDAASSAWNYGNLGVYLGNTGFQVAQINGRTELFFGGYTGGSGNVNDSWSTLRWDPESQTMQRVHASRPYDNFLNLVRVLDVNGDGRDEVLVGVGASLYGKLEFYDAETKTPIVTLDPRSNLFTEAKMVDVDQDGDRELLILTVGSLLILDNLRNFPNGEVSISRLSNVGGRSFFVGQLDQDPPLEILFTWGGVLEVGSWKEEWNLGDMNPDFLVRGLVDRDNDGISEMLVTTAKEVITLDLTSRAQVWKQQVDINLKTFEFHLSQLDSDPALEFLFANSRVVTMDSVSGEIESDVSFPEDMGLLALADVDNDGTNEAVLWRGERYLMDNWEYMVVARMSDQSILWSSNQIGGFSSPAMGDIDGDGQPELVLDYVSGVAILNPVTSQLIAHFRPPGNTEVYDVKDVNGDGRCEILVGGTYDYYFNAPERGLWVYEYADGKFSPIWEKIVRDPIYPNGETTYVNGSLADVDGDGVPEVVAGWTLATADWADSKFSGIEVYRLSDGEALWRSPRERASMGAISVADFDQDGEIEVAVLHGEKWLRIWNPATGRQEFKLRGNFTSLAPTAQGFATGHKSGYVSRFSRRKKGYARTSYHRAAKKPIHGITTDTDGESLWLANVNRYTWLPKRPKHAFSIEGDRYAPEKVVIYPAPDGEWLFTSFHRLVRGFPLGREEED